MLPLRCAYPDCLPMTILNARNISLDEVHQLLKLEARYDGSFTPLLSFEPLTDLEREELRQIRDDFYAYLSAGKVTEGQVKLLIIGPLLRLAGFYHPPIKISLEEDIADINIVDEETTITGRFDILAVNKDRIIAGNICLWILVIETKNSLVDVTAGLPQLLSYAFKSLDHQTSVWGLVTNGLRYQFVYIQVGTPPTYPLMPLLNLMEAEHSTQIVQSLKAICR